VTARENFKELSGVGRRVAANAVRLVRRIGARNALGKPQDRDSLWLLLRVGDEISEQRPARFAFTGRGEPRSLAWVDLLRALESAGKDTRVRGVVLRFEDGLTSATQAATLRRAVCALREAGKLVWAWSEGYDALQLQVASAADRIEVAPSGSVHLVGMRTQQMFGRSLLDKIGVRADVVRIGSHKAAAEPFSRNSMSEPQREQLEAWQGIAFDELVAALSQGRKLEAEAVRAAIDEGPFGAEAALERGLIDALSYPDELEARLKLETRSEHSSSISSAASDKQGADADTDEDAAPLVDIATYSALHASDTGWRPVRGDLPRFAYVVARGGIGRGRGTRGIASQRYAEVFARLRKNDDVQGVVLRIESGGGDAVASDLLHRSIEQLAAEKPVVVSMGSVAASGGYYMAAAAHRIFAERATLTGSIGVIGGKLDLSRLYERLGIGVDAVESGARAGVHSETRGFTPDERRALQREMRAMYATFKERVGRGRNLDEGAVERAAQGRIWSGEHAVGLGLVDAIGGPLEALAEVCERAGVRRGEPFVLDILPERNALPGLGSLLGAGAANARTRLRGRVRLS
jgi:protease-4